MPEARNVTRPPRFHIQYDVASPYRESVLSLPWEAPLAEWGSEGVRILTLRRGEGRHPLLFVHVDGQRFAVKELGLSAALKEIENYRELRRRGIETLVPVGTVVRDEAPLAVATPAGIQYERNAAAYSITLVHEHVVPDSLLYPRSFRPESRERIWDAVLDLFVALHMRGVFWGDGSLANCLVRFAKEDVPYLGRRTVLRAVLADAETVEIHRSLTRPLRLADLRIFLESMAWIHEDMRRAGQERSRRELSKHRRFVRETYRAKYRAARRARSFSRRTGLDVETLLGRVRDASYLDALEAHIGEHRWYLGERRAHAVSLAEAAADWLRAVFEPACRLFSAEEVTALFPGRTAAELYVEVMTHKYFLSEQEGRDVGMPAALRDYVEKYGERRPPASFWRRLSRALAAIFVGRRVAGGEDF